jgi:hypothetical protein
VGLSSSGLGFEGDERALQSGIAICAPVMRWRGKVSIRAMRSTRRRHTGILMNVHQGPPARELVFRNHSFSARPWMNNPHSFDSQAIVRAWRHIVEAALSVPNSFRKR